MFTGEFVALLNLTLCCSSRQLNLLLYQLLTDCFRHMVQMAATTTDGWPDCRHRRCRHRLCGGGNRRRRHRLRKATRVRDATPADDADSSVVSKHNFS